MIILVSDFLPPGNYVVTWDLREVAGRRLANGFYGAQLFVADELFCDGDIRIVSAEQE